MPRKPKAPQPHLPRKACSFQHEQALCAKGIFPIVGIDEAGRGPLAGPVVAAAVMLPEGFTHPTLTDSKALTPAQREALYTELTPPGSCIHWAVAIVEAAEIDRLNILRATHHAMRQALATLESHSTLPCAPRHALIDGLPVHPFPLPQTALVKGDAQSFSIAAASVIAKVTRDRLMLEWDQRYPIYQFSKHKGYGTAAHLALLRIHGPCPIHRRSFLPVRQAQLDLFGAPENDVPEHAAHKTPDET